jgi:hypothetical protein
LVAALLALASGPLLSSGCMSSETPGSRPATGTWGYVSTAKNASIEIDPEHSNVASVVAKRVAAPVDGFIVATASTAATGPAMQVGLVPVKRGVSTDVLIPIMGARSGVVVLTLYADNGTKGRLDSDPMDPTSSPDRPIFVDGKPVAVTVPLSEPEVPMGAGAALLDVFDQPASRTLNVTHVVAPGPSWIVVSADENGAPGRVLGQLSIPATDAIGVGVPLARPAKGRVFVSLLSDGGTVGALEYQGSRGSTPTGPDVPYVVGGGEVVTRAELR